MTIEELLDYALIGGFIVAAILSSPVLIVLVPLALIGWAAKKLGAWIKTRAS